MKRQNQKFYRRRQDLECFGHILPTVIMTALKVALNGLLTVKFKQNFTILRGRNEYILVRYQV